MRICERVDKLHPHVDAFEGFLKLLLGELFQLEQVHELWQLAAVPD